MVPELCSMTGLTDEMRQDTNLTAQVAKVTRVDPRVRMERLEALVE